MRNSLFFLFITICFTAFCNKTNAQTTTYNPNSPPNDYQSPQNPYYWKNRPPSKSYWQQDVHYIISADIDEKTDQIKATQTLEYWNNSPDTLYEVFFHLYQNAFQPESHLDELNEANQYGAKYGKYEEKKLGTVIHSLHATFNKKKYEVEQTLDNTILRVKLPFGILPNSSVTFDTEFTTYFDSGNVRRRMKKFNSKGKTHYDGVHWYPRISVYDQKFGWDTQQHLGREFYGDYGTYDVTLYFANDYVVDATGTLQNKNEAMPPDLRQKLDIRNFANKAWESAPSEIITRIDGQRKKWHFYAENVHDFAFTADPNYRIGEYTWNNITCVALAQEQHAAGWQNAAQFAANCIELYSKDIGMYAYPKMIVADAQDGMEYPMLTLDGGSDPSYRYLLAHEIGHNWFYGMVGNNETYRAFLDEGFTQFLTAWAQESLNGRTVVTNKTGKKYYDKFKKPLKARESTVYNGYISDVMNGGIATLNTHSDAFNSALGHGGGYRQVYMKTATMLYNLQYVLGDSLFLHAMQFYFNRWKFCHPYPEDFRQAITDATHTDLNWFFDQWLETEKTIDYGIKKVRELKNKEYEITLSRKQRMQMPIDLQIESKTGEAYNFYIPNTWFEKKTNATILPKWYGWDKLHPTYTFKTTIPGGIKNIKIDTTHRLADIYALDNEWKTPIDCRFDSKIGNPTNRHAYELKHRPDIWYNKIDLAKIGWHFNGHYLYHKHNFSLTTWLNTGAFFASKFKPRNIASLNFNYLTQVGPPDTHTRLGASVRLLDGIAGFTTILEKNLYNGDLAEIYIKSIYLHDKDYVLYPNEWQENAKNNTVNFTLKHNYKYLKGNGAIKVAIRSHTLFSDFDYNLASLEVVNNNLLGKFNLRTRYYLQVGTGKKPPTSGLLYLAGANPEALTENKFTRAAILDAPNWNYRTQKPLPIALQQGGGLNIRGYADYTAPETNKKGEVNSYAYQALSGSSTSFELDFQNIINLKPKLTRNWLHIDTYLFADAGLVNKAPNKLFLSNIYANAGAGMAFTIKKFGVLETLKPLTFRTDLPLIYSQKIGKSYFKPRLIIGINRAF